MEEDFVVDEVVIPSTIDAPNASDFIEMTRVRNEIEAESVGSWDLAYEAAELLPSWQRSWEPKQLLVARSRGEIVGRAVVEFEPEDIAGSIAWVVVEVLSSHRGRGIGSALFDRAMELVAAAGKTVVQTYAPQKITAGPSIAAPTGFGSVPRDSASTRFLLSRGFELEQVERMSRLPLPADLDSLWEDALAAAGPEYRVISWSGPTPPEHRPAIALLRTRMNTDAPAAGLEITTDEWTPERVAEDDEAIAASPRTQLTSLVIHEPTGTGAGFTELSVPPQRSRAVSQGDTIVLREHRGHRLGMLLKIANLRFLEEVAPGHPSVTTFNAEENRHMLSVNEAIGFEAWGYEGAWKKVLNGA